VIHLLADRHIFLVDRLVNDDIRLTLFDSLGGLPTDTDADAVLVRTVTKVPESWLERNPSIRFAGTASAGFDHFDTVAFEKRGIAWGNSPGCNARSVAEWVVAVLLTAFSDIDEVRSMRVGILGVGNAGGAVANLLEKLGVPTLLYDPPREVRDPGFKSCSIEEVLEAEILTVHTPLQEDTYHLLGDTAFSRRHKLVLNASRGGVLDEEKALKALQNGQLEMLALDVWENEPVFRDDSSRMAFVATPHIAGYSFRSKINATRIVTERILKFFGIESRIDWPEPALISKEWEPGRSFVDQIHPLNWITEEFKALAGKSDAEKARQFHTLRQRLNTRTDWCDFSFSGVPAPLQPLMYALGIQVS
jgi:erythronate-4-phosphate dehydrogenase